MKYPCKIKESTYGPHIYMELYTKSGMHGEIDVYLRESGTSFKTSADNDMKQRNEIINAFLDLY